MWGKEDEHKRRQKNGLFFILFFNTSLFGHILKKINTQILVHGYSSSSTFALRLVRGPKGL